MISMADPRITYPDCHIVNILFLGQFGNAAYVAIHPAAAPDIHTGRTYVYRDMIEIDLSIDEKPCTTASKDAFLEALRDWLQARYDEGDRTYDGLSAFVETARVEYLQPMEAA